LVFRPIERPVSGPDAFREKGDAASLSRAAILLILRAQLRGDDRALEARAGETNALAIPEEDLSRFPVPRLRRAGARIPRDVIRERIGRTYSLEVKEGAFERESARLSDEVVPELVDRLYEAPSLMAAAELAEACLSHPDELTRVAAAAAHFEISSSPDVIEILGEATKSRVELVQAVAATALARVAPADKRLARLTKERRRKPGGSPTRTSLLVHGTFARNHGWWQPGGNFHSHLTGIRPDLYAASDRFEWSGGYSDAARALGASDLTSWTNARALDGLDLFNHSHGGSVAMLASQSGLSVGKLVLLSAPAHPHKYMPDFNRVSQVISIRVHLDLVILVDGGGQRFQHPNIVENVLPLWFDHSVTHRPSVWNKYGVSAMI
jgi:hypothetical protein